MAVLTAACWVERTADRLVDSRVAHLVFAKAGLRAAPKETMKAAHWVASKDEHSAEPMVGMKVCCLVALKAVTMAVLMVDL
jgi:hypothetical protein